MRQAKNHHRPKRAVAACVLSSGLIVTSAGCGSESAERLGVTRKALDGAFEQSLACVEGYANGGKCDWFHWTEMYLTCETHRHAALDDGYLLDEVKAGRCTPENWSMIRAEITGEQPPVVVTPEVESRLSLALAPSAALTSDESFVLTQAEWFTIQRYATVAMALPHTEPLVRAWLQMDAADDYTDFVPLEGALADVRKHGFEWEQDIFPRTVDLAVDVGNYADTASVFYGPLQDVLDILRRDPDDEVAATDLVDLVDALAGEAEAYEQRAAEVEQDLHGFATALEGDAARLGQVRSDYDEKYESQDGELARLNAEIEALDAELAQLQKDYDHYVVVAATTPTYAWAAWPFGLIAATSVAGVYGDKAVKTLDLIHEKQGQIDAKNTRVGKITRLMRYVRVTTDNLSDIRDAVAAAIPAVQKVRAHWQVMHGDLEKIATLMRDDVLQASPLIAKLQVRNALKEWEAVAESASAYIANAYIKVAQ